MNRGFQFRPRVTRLAGEAREVLGSDPVDALLVGLATRPGLVVLDSAGGAPRRFSLLAFDPLAEIGTEGLRVADLAGLRRFAQRLTRGAGDALPGPFAGGFLGALSYELGIDGENLALPPHVWGAPPVVGGLYCDFFVVDHARGEVHLALGENPGDGRAPWRQRRDEILAGVRSSPVLEPDVSCGDPSRSVPAAEHRARIERLRSWIAAGELYQANLAHAFEVAVVGKPSDLYRRLRRVNPAPYAGYLAWGEGSRSRALLSASPELLVELEGRRARTRPIKGTAPRGVDAEDDARRRRELLRSEKDLAELAMIVDLERNDLGRVAEPGSVAVPRFPELESYAAVHHLVADVTARTREGVDAFDVLAALFPGGSITGAPKIASMRAIAALEGTGRGFFTGSMGFVDTRGNACFNILIRTLEWRTDPLPAAGHAGRASFHVGGGITWSSDPHAEERETLDKGSALVAALVRPGARRAPVEGFGALAPLWTEDAAQRESGAPQAP